MISVAGTVSGQRSAGKGPGPPGPLNFRRAMDKAGNPAGYDAEQTAIVSVTKNGRYAIEK